MMKKNNLAINKKENKEHLLKYKSDAHLKNSNSKSNNTRTESNPAVWKQVSEWLEKGMIGKGIFGGTSPNSYNRIREFQAVMRNRVDDFRYWHVEDLLDQAAGLIDRAIANRTAWNEKLSKAFYVESEIREYVEIEKIYAKEVLSGLYETPYKEADLEYQALQKFLQYNMLPYGTVQAVKFIYDNNYQSYPPPKDSISEWRWVVEKNSLIIRLDELDAENESTLLRRDSAYVRKEWENVNRVYKKQRADAARKTAEEKAAAFTKPGGALNYLEQMNMLQNLIARDAGDAFVRLKVAALGLQKIYGYTIALPISITKAIDSGKADHNTLEDAYIWARDSITWLTAFKQLDQNFVLPVSLRSLISAEQWKEFIKQKTSTFPLNAVPYFKDFTNVRLRGVRGFIYGIGIDAGFWRIELEPPQQATILHQGENRFRKLDQSKLPKVIIPRAGSRLNSQEVEFVGSNALYNTSPIGQWTITISSESSRRIPVTSIDDLELELVVAVRSA